MTTSTTAGRVAAGSGLVLSVLAAGQFLMTLDGSVMNVSIRQVAADVGTTVTGIQTAITRYTLVMASLMIIGGAIVGMRRAFIIGLVIYGAGSLTTALSPNLGGVLKSGTWGFVKAKPARLGLLSVTAGTLVLIGGISPAADAGVVAVPMLPMGLGIGALASQLGAVTVSAVSDRESAEVGGLQNTVTDLGAGLGTALAGAVLIASLTTGLINGVQASPAIPADVKTQATTQFAPGVPFTSDTGLKAQLEKANVPPAQADAVLQANSDARLAALRASLWVVALVAVVALFFTGLIRPIGRPRREVATSSPAAGGAD